MSPPDSQTAVPLSQVAAEQVPKMKAFMKGLGLSEGKDFTVGTSGKGDKHRIDIKLNTGYHVGSYRPGIQQQLNGTGLTLHIENATLFQRVKETS